MRERHDLDRTSPPDFNSEPPEIEWVGPRPDANKEADDNFYIGMALLIGLFLGMLIGVFAL